MSIAAIREVLFDIAPSYITVDTAQLARIDRFIVRAQREVNADLWGEKYSEGVAWLTWHKLLSAGIDSTGDAARGQLLEEKVDNAHYKYADSGSSSQAKGPHSSTYPGREFDAMAESVFAEPWAL